MDNDLLPATAFKSPAIALSGVVDYEMYTNQTHSTMHRMKDRRHRTLHLGRDPEVARMMARRPVRERDGANRRSSFWQSRHLFRGRYFHEFLRTGNRYLARGTA